MQRQFTSGSRQAPDPFDQFLEEHQFYRKHTARDASCLFRVISEQMYDTQLHHLAIREKCVTYMRKHRKYFDYLVDRDFDEYLDDMSKPKTYGTLVELQAAGYMFERNVLLFQPFNLGNYFNEYRSNFHEVFCVFHTPERHFDSVFTSEYIQEAAICQSICYEILYKDLFKLPDVSFAVEQMLHGPTFDNMDYRTETNEEGYSTRIDLNDGRSFELDLPHNTNCILENYKLCHFHYTNFPRYSDDLQRELKIANCEEYEKTSLLIQRTAESFLPNKYVSCVRQLLQEGITPFPYKVAKALDPNMYRNIEFDSWNEMRKELKLQNWYNGDANFKVGAKCYVKLPNSEQDLYTCHIQEIAVDEDQCIVFVEQLGEKRLVPYENLTPLPPDQFKPWTVPYRLQRHMQKYSSVRFTRQYNYRFKPNINNEHHHHHNEYACGSILDNDASNNCIDDDPKKLSRLQNDQHCNGSAPYFKLKQYTQLEDFRRHVEYCTMPLTVAHSGREVDGSKCGNQQRPTESNEISRAPSRSSTTAATQRNNVECGHNKSSGNNGVNNCEEHLGPPPAFVVPHVEGYEMDHYNQNGITYMPEMQSFYPMYPYPPGSGMPDDYGYCGYEGGIPPGATFMPALNGVNGFYYFYNNAIAPPPGNYINLGNPYFPPPPPPPPPQTLGAPQPTAMLTSVNGPNASYHTNTSLHNGFVAPQSTQTLQTTVSNTHSRPSNRSVPNTPTTTPLSGRINYDAKKSLKANGTDLPSDVTTLRFFYNLGIDYYHKQKSNETENPTSNLESTGDSEKLSNDVQNIKLDENANQVLSTKLDTNNNNFSAPSNDFPKTNETNPSTNQADKHATAGGNKNNQRRYTSHYFSGKDRQMLHRNNSNPNVQNTGRQHQQQQQHQHQQQHQQHQQNHSQRNQAHFNNKYSSTNSHNISNTPNAVRNAPPQTNQNLSHVPATEQSRQMSPTSGYNDSNRANSVESQSCHTPTTNNTNSNVNVTYGNNCDQINDGISSGGNVVGGGQLGVSLQSTTGGLYIPIPMTAGPPPYGIFASHPNTGTHQAPGVGMHPNYMAGPPPQLITHCGLPPPTTIHGPIASGPGPDHIENVCNSDMTANNGGGLIGMGPPSMQFQCPNYPPPLPFFYTTNGINSGTGGDSGGVGGPLPHLVAPFSHQVAPSTPSNQTAFASPHLSMGTQGYYCLQPPPPLLPQVTPQMMPQPPPMPTNRTPVVSTLSNDINNGSRNDLVTPNND